MLVKVRQIGASLKKGTPHAGTSELHSMKRLIVWTHSSTFVRLRAEIGDNVFKAHQQRKIGIEDGAARVRSEAPSWTLRSCAIR